MPEPVNTGSLQPELLLQDQTVTRRVLHVMAVITGVAVGISLPLATWRVTTGLLLGGILSLLNFHWMRSSVAAAFNVLASGAKPRIGIAQYILRYLIVGLMVYAGYKTNLVSLPATIVGLSSFVVALFVEALRESYLILTHREGIN